MKSLILVTNPNQTTVLSASSGDEISSVRQQKKGLDARAKARTASPYICPLASRKRGNGGVNAM